MQDASASEKHSIDKAEWVEHFVREMMSASNIDDAKARASRTLEVLEKSIRVHATVEAAQSFQQVFYLLMLTVGLSLSCSVHSLVSVFLFLQVDILGCGLFVFCFISFN